MDVNPKVMNAQGDLVSEFDAVGMGGGSTNSGTSSTRQGEVFIVGGNIFTEITSIVGGDPTQHAWTLPWENNTGFPAFSSTATAIKVETPDTEVGNEVTKVAFRYQDASTPSVPAYYYDYGVNDTFVTYNSETGKGEVWLWVPSDFNLIYDLNSGIENSVCNFNISYANRKAVGHTSMTIDQTSSVYHYPGELKTLITYDQWIDAGDAYAYDGAAWDVIDPSANYLGTEFYELLTHPQVSGVDVAFVGWSDTPVSHIFDVNDGWDYTQHTITEVQFSQNDVTVYAVWGYDRNGNGKADVLENYQLFYKGNAVGAGTPGPAVSGTPSNGVKYSEGDLAPVATTTPVHSYSYIFMGWTDETSPGTGYALLQAGDTVPANLYIGGSGTIDYGSGFSVTGSTTVTMPDANKDIYALWGEDINGNGIPDVLEPVRYLIHDANGGTGAPGNKIYVDGAIGVTDPGSAMITPSGTASEIFLGWTEDASVLGHIFAQGEASLLPTDITNPITDPLTLSALFNGSDITVYAVWG